MDEVLMELGGGFAANLFHDLLELLTEHVDGVMPALFPERADAIHE